MKLTYKFNNDEKRLDIERLDYLSPLDTEIYVREGDTIYVKDGDYLYINQLIKESTSGIKTYATISGTVELKDGIIKVINDKSDSSFVSEEAVSKIDEVKKEEIIKRCESLGIDYENKLIVNKLKGNSRLLIVNAMDVEPYQFNNNYLFQDNVSILLDTISLISKRFNIDAYLLLNKYDDNNVNAVKKVIRNYSDINLKVIEDVFPFNTNQLVVKKFFKEYKYDDILFLDTFALYKIFYAIKNGLPVSERYITVNLGNPNKAYVIKTKYGANVGEMIKETIKVDFIDKDIYLNNFMRKVKCDNLDSLIVTDNIKSVFIFPKEDILPSKCIKCGKCVDICPVGINPLAKKLDSACIRCGLCNYVCPANINLISKEK